MADYKALRKRLVEQLVYSSGVKNKRVLKAMLAVPRHVFVAKEYKDKAYLDVALPIGKDQTISQPSVVGLMSQALNLKADEKVLEIGTGSGYQTSVLGLLAGHVYSIEIIESLYRKAKKAIKRLGYKNIHLYLGNGSRGLPKYSPFDAIIITAGCREIPAPLLAQLREGGRIVAPLGNFHEQELRLGVKKQNKLEFKNLGAVRFVPLVESD